MRSIGSRSRSGVTCSGSADARTASGTICSVGCRGFTGAALNARDGLVVKGLLHYEPGTPGRGHRSLYRLLFNEQILADERALQDDPVKPARVRAFSAETPAQKPALERACRKQGKSTNPLLDREVSPKAPQADVPGEGGSIDALLASTDRLLAMVRQPPTRDESRAWLDALPDEPRRADGVSERGFVRMLVESFDAMVVEHGTAA
jgi:hypothetical protein